MRSKISYWILFILNAWSWYPLWGTLIYAWPLSYSYSCLIWPPINPRGLHETKENRIFSRGEFTWKKCKTAILLYCFHTASLLHIFILYNLLGPGISFYKKSKINIRRKPSYEIGWFHNWPMIISHRLYAFHFTNDDFPL